MTPTTSGELYRIWAGLALLLLGLAADGAAGAVVLGAADPRGYLVHIPAVLSYALGIGLLDHKTAGGREGAPANAGRRDRGLRGLLLTRWSATAALLGLGLFPGLGPLCCTFAFGASRWRRGAELARSNADEPEALAPAIASRKIVEPLVDLQVEPLVDALPDADVALKRAAIAMVTRWSPDSAVRVLRGLLSDSDPGVRQDAGVALSRIEQGLDRSIGSARERMLESPESERYAEFARLCCRYVSSGLLDDAGRSYYLEQARKAFDKAVSLEPARSDLRLELAKVRLRLDQAPLALIALDRVISRGSADIGAYLVGMEAAFAEGNWEDVVKFARAGRVAATHDPAVASLVFWWAEARPPDMRWTSRF